MTLRFGPRVPRGPAIPDHVLRSLVACAVVAIVAVSLAACGSGSAASQTAQPTSAAPSVAASTAPPASPTPTASPTSTGGGTARIALAGLSSVIDKPAQTVDPSTFTTTFVSETPAIYVLYQLSPGTSGKVVSTWKKDDVVLNTFSLDYPASAPWAYFEITYQNGFIPGDYEEMLTVVETGDTLTLPFTVTGPRKAPASPTPVPSGTSAFTLLSMATFADSTQPAPDSSAFTESFPTTAPKLYVVFALRPGLTGSVVCTMTVDGEDMIQPITINYGSGNSWGDFEISPAGTFPAGDYVAKLTYEPSGEVVTIPFTVN